MLSSRTMRRISAACWKSFRPKFLRRYADLAGDVRAAVRRFADDVRAGTYPGAEHSF
jgi:ketopantoate hydroxymethyltransferase